MDAISKNPNNIENEDNEKRIKNDVPKKESVNSQRNEEDKIPYPNDHACRIASPTLFEKGSFRTIEKKSDGKTFRIIIGRKKGQTTTSTQALRYNKETWSRSEAAAACKRHNGTFEPAFTECSQKETIELLIESGYKKKIAKQIAEIVSVAT